MRQEQQAPLIRRHVRTFTELVESVGRLHAQIGHERLVYRGQTREYGSLERPTIHSKFDRLCANDDEARRSLDHALRKLARGQDSALKGKNRTVAAEALAAHYEYLATRMLDCTQILQVAASFALANYGSPQPHPAVVYVLDVRNAPSTPARGRFGACQVASVTAYDATRPMRQGAWVLWKHGVTDTVEFGTLICAAFTIDRDNRGGFWDCVAKYDHEWLMSGDKMSEWFQRPGNILHPPPRRTKQP